MQRSEVHTSLEARRALLRATLRAFDVALARSPDDEALKARRAQLVGTLRGVVPPDELERLREHLAEVEAEMERGVTDPHRVRDVVLAYQRLLEEIREIGDDPR